VLKNDFMNTDRLDPESQTMEQKASKWLRKLCCFFLNLEEELCLSLGIEYLRSIGIYLALTKPGLGVGMSVAGKDVGCR